MDMDIGQRRPAPAIVEWAGSPAGRGRCGAVAAPVPGPSPPAAEEDRGVAEATAEEGIDHRAPGDTLSTFTTGQTSVTARDTFKDRSVMHNKMSHQTVGW